MLYTFLINMLIYKLTMSISMKCPMQLHAATYLKFGNGIVNDSKYFTLLFISVALQCSLHVAAGQGDLSAVKTHVDRGADINAKDDNGVSVREIS